MKRFAIVCALVLLLNVLCPVGHMHAEEISTPTDVECTHSYTEWKAYDQNTCMMYCSDCGEPTGVQQGHVELCTNPGVCHTCGSADVNLQFGHSGGTTEPTVQYDAYTHWTVCSGCNAKLDEAQHTGATCDNNACEVCGAECAEELVEHYVYSMSYDYDDDVHWARCDECGKVMSEPEPHYGGDCLNAICDGCNRYHFPNPPHIGEDIYLYIPGEAGHFLGCTHCDSPVGQPSEPHEVSCMDDSVCLVCSKPNPEDAIVKHTGDLVWMHELTHHWQVCTACNNTEEKLNYGPHDSLEGCSVCGFDCAHENTSAWVVAGDFHYRNCLDCGLSVDRAEHYSEDAAGICAVCGASFADCDNGAHGVMGRFFDETHHWFGCEKCGAVLGNYEEHFVLCAQTDLTKCQTCDATVDPTKVEMQHASSEEGWVAVDAYTHRITCVCGEETEEWGHSKHCQADVCEYCGYEGELLNGGVYHNFDGKYEYDEHFHWGVCVDCGKSENFQTAHIQQDCKSDICQVCGATFDNDQHYGYTDEYEYDENGHWFTCTDCGEKTEPQEHMYVCDEPNGCTTCGYKPSGTVNVSHWWTEEITDCGEYHARICPKCGEENFIQPHVVSCAKPGACVTCGATNVMTESQSHKVSGYESDGTNHWQVCSACGQKCNEMPHRANCAAPGVCVTCGLKNDSIPVNDHDVFNSKVYHDETTHWRICTKCGEKAFEGKHYEYCQETNGCCYECGYVGDVEPEHQALKAGWVNDADSHWKVCAVCQKVVDKVAHADGNSDGKCDACGYTLVHTHAWGEPMTVPATCASNGSTTTTCTTCGEKTVETIPATGKHTWGAPVTAEATCVAAGSKTTACTACGEKTVETIPATGKHSWETVNRVYATCTKAGRTERVCTVCDELSVTTQGAKGHAYGLVFITEGNGTHAKTCETCGAKHVEDCVLTSTEMSNMVCSACATCGYAVYTMADSVLEEVEGLTEAKAEIEVKRVENVSFEIVAEPVEEGTEAETETEAEAEPTETADVVLVVHETELEMTVELPDTVNASVKKVLAVSMLKEGNAIQPSSKVKLSIPVVEEEVTGMKLVLMGEDGQLIEIAYEIIDGVIVFETDMVGIFLFVEAEA